MADLQQWSAQLVVQAGLNTPGDFCLVVLGHDPGCALHPSAPWRPTAPCRCGPDVSVIVNPGPHERLVHLLRDGELLPIVRWNAARDAP